MAQLLTASFSEVNGSGTVTNNISNFNFGSTDAPNLNPLNYPIAKGSNSYSKWIYGNFYVASGTLWLYNPVYSLSPTSSQNLSINGRIWISTNYTAPGTASTGDALFPNSTYQFASIMSTNNTNASPVNGSIWSTAGTFSAGLISGLTSYANAQPLRLQLNVGTLANSFNMNPVLTLTWQEAQ